MPIDDLISMKPNPPPPMVEDLAALAELPARLSISGKTRNLGRLADLPPIEALWVSDVNQKRFDGLVPLIDPQYLHFYGMRVADLAPIGRLSRLQALEINWNTKVTDISFLKDLKGLRLLALYDCPKVTDLGPVAGLENLEIFDLFGGMWNTAKPDTLKPLAGLRKLRGLSLKSIRVGDQSLAPIAGLKQLEALELSNQFPTEEYARLSVALPHVKCEHFAPYFHVSIGAPEKQVLVTGKGKPILTLPKDAARLERYEQRFREMQEKFREGQGSS